MTQMPSETTRADVQRLWSEALADESSHPTLRERVEAQMDRADSESPVVNWGLTSLHAGLHAQLDVDHLAEAHSIWLQALSSFDTDPSAWVTNYFVSMIKGFAEVHGTARATAFGSKLVAQGLLASQDVAGALGPT